MEDNLRKIGRLPQIQRDNFRAAPRGGGANCIGVGAGVSARSGRGRSCDHANYGMKRSSDTGGTATPSKLGSERDDFGAIAVGRYGDMARPGDPLRTRPRAPTAW